MVSTPISTKEFSILEKMKIEVRKSGHTISEPAGHIAMKKNFEFEWKILDTPTQ